MNPISFPLHQPTMSYSYRQHLRSLLVKSLFKFDFRRRFASRCIKRTDDRQIARPSAAEASDALYSTETGDLLSKVFGKSYKISQNRFRLVLNQVADFHDRRHFVIEPVDFHCRLRELFAVVDAERRLVVESYLKRRSDKRRRAKT